MVTTLVFDFVTDDFAQENFIVFVNAFTYIITLWNN